MVAYNPSSELIKYLHFLRGRDMGFPGVRDEWIIYLEELSS